jgi:hypothetical protein
MQTTLSATDSYLLANGCKLWEKAGRRRVYLGQVAEDLLGLRVNRYGTGNISSATLDGEKISNRLAGQMVLDVSGAYWDIDRQVVVNAENAYVDDIATELARRVGAP